MTIYNPAVYTFTLVDVPGVALANNYLSFFNPANSGRSAIALQLSIYCYATGTTSVAKSMLTKRITAASGGTLIAANTIGRFQTFYSDPILQVRIDNPTVTTTGLVINAIPPVISVGVGVSSSVQSATAGSSFVYAPGEGGVLYTEAGDTDQVWTIQFVWSEVGG